jgi:general secretion pathway protein I
MDDRAGPPLRAMTFPPCRPFRGFTLVEVLVSLAIFALAAVVLSVAYLNIIGSYRGLGIQHQEDEDWKLLRAVVLTEPELAKVEEGGRIALANGRQLNWKATVEPTQVADLFQLTLEADSPASGEAEAWQRRQVLHLLRPSWSDPAEREELREKTRQRIARERAR